MKHRMQNAIRDMRMATHKLSIETDSYEKYPGNLVYAHVAPKGK